MERHRRVSVNDDLPTEEYTSVVSLRRDRTRWWNWLFPLLVLMLAAALIGIYHIPTNLNLVAPVQAWLFLCAALLLFLVIRLNITISAPAYNGIIIEPDGRPLVWHRKAYLRLLGLASVLLVGFAALDLGAEFVKVSSFSIEMALRHPLSLVAIGLLTTSLLGLLWLWRIPVVQRVIDTHFGNAGVALVVGLASLWLYSQTPQALRPQTPTSFASWSEVLRFARHQVDKVDKEAVLVTARADQPYWYDGPYRASTTPLRLRLGYWGVKGRVTIEVLDSDPPRIESFDAKPASGDDIPSKEDLDEFRRNLAHLTLGPRDVFRLTEAEGEAFARDRDISVVPNISTGLYQSWSEVFGVPTGWNIFYNYDIFQNSRDLNDKYTPDRFQSLLLRVDGASGKVVDREFHPDDTGATP
jgi:hypothetical protein